MIPLCPEAVPIPTCCPDPIPTLFPDPIPEEPGSNNGLYFLSFISHLSIPLP